MNRFIFILFLFCVCSCTKSVRFQNRLDGNWIIERIKVTDGQGDTHIIENAEGQLSLDFTNAVSAGSCNFTLEFNSIIYPFELSFDGNNLVLNESKERLDFGGGAFRNTYQVILLTKRDLVLEYYDPLNFQLRKFIFVKEE